MYSLPGDWYGVGLAFRGGGGIAYYFLRWFGLSLESSLNLGFSWVDNDAYPDSGGTALLRSIDFLLGVEFLF